GGFGEWGMKTTPASRLELFLLERSHLATLAFGSYRAWIYNGRRSEIQQQIERVMWQASAEALDAIVATTQRAGAPLAAILHPAARPQNLGIWVETRRRLRSLLDERGIPFLDLTPAI